MNRITLLLLTVLATLTVACAPAELERAPVFSTELHYLGAPSELLPELDGIGDHCRRDYHHGLLTIHVFAHRTVRVTCTALVDAR